MNEQFDDIENKIITAAENVEIPYNEESWLRLEEKLDKKDDRKKPLFWIIPFLLLLISGILGVIYSNSSANKSNPVSVKLHDGSAALSARPFNEQAISLAAPGGKPTSTVVNDAFTEPVVSNSINNKAAGIRKGNRVTSAKHSVEITSPEPFAENHQEEFNRNNDPVNRPLIIEKESLSIYTGQTEEIQQPVSETNINIVDSVSEVKELSEKKELPAIDSVTKNGKDDPKRKQKGFYITALIGADMSNVKFLSFENSPLVARYGIGLGYRLNDRWSIQTGLLISNKKYLAGPADYKVEPGSYLSQVNIIEVDAACKMLEIPLSVRYNMIRRENYQVYSSVGVSSYLIRKESYKYTYSNYYGIVQHPYDYSGNKNLFSLFTFSPGYERILNGKLSITCEAFFNVPFNGVGEGKVKLYSSGIQLGLKHRF